MVQSPRKNSARLSAGPCRIRLRAFRLHPSPPRPLPSATLSLCDPSPPRPLPTAGPFGCPLCPFWLWRGGRAVNVEQPSVLRGTACAVRQRLGLYGEGRHDGRTAVAGSARWAGRMADGGCRVCKVRLVAWRTAVAGSARWAGRMAGGDCRGCKGESGSGGGRRTRLRINGGTV